MRLQAGLFGLGGDGPSEASPTASLAKPSEDQSTESPKPFQGKNQGENDTKQRNEITETGPSAATQVASRLCTNMFHGDPSSTAGRLCDQQEDTALAECMAPADSGQGTQLLDQLLRAWVDMAGHRAGECWP